MAYFPFVGALDSPLLAKPWGAAVAAICFGRGALRAPAGGRRRLLPKLQAAPPHPARRDGGNAAPIFPVRHSALRGTHHQRRD
jgi:hypothetical protein